MGSILGQALALAMTGTTEPSHEPHAGRTKAPLFPWVPQGLGGGASPTWGLHPPRVGLRPEQARSLGCGRGPDVPGGMRKCRHLQPHPVPSRGQPASRLGLPLYHTALADMKTQTKVGSRHSQGPPCLSSEGE